MNALGLADDALLTKVLEMEERDPVTYKRRRLSMLSVAPLCYMVMKVICSHQMSQEVEMMLCAVLLWLGKCFLGI